IPVSPTEFPAKSSFLAEVARSGCCAQQWYAARERSLCWDATYQHPPLRRLDSGSRYLASLSDGRSEASLITPDRANVARMVAASQVPDPVKRCQALHQSAPSCHLASKSI